MRSVMVIGVILSSIVLPPFKQRLGELRVLIRDVELKLNGEVINKLPAGATVVVLDEKDNLLFAGIGRTGWFSNTCALALEEGLAHFDRAIELNPNDADVFNHRAVLLSRCPDETFRDGLQGVKDGLRACELGNWKPPHYVSNLAAAIVQAGDSKEATALVESAVEKAPKDTRSKIEKAIQIHLQKAKSSKPH